MQEPTWLTRSVASIRAHWTQYRQSAKIRSLTDRAIALRARYRELDNIDDLNELNESILAAREALALCTRGHPLHATSLSNLAFSLITRYEQLEETQDLEECILLNRDALNLRPSGHPDRSTSLANLACALIARYEQLGNVEDLQECISLNCEAISLHPPGDPLRSIFLNNLAPCLHTRYKRLGKVEDLEECISFNREALTLCAPGHRYRPVALNNLSTSLSTRYGHLGKIEDLEECLVLKREALNLCPPGHRLRPTVVNNLALALTTRYEQLGDIEDLEESIMFHRETLTLFPPGHSDISRSTSLNNLALALMARHKWMGTTEDLEDCILLNREALALCPPGHQDHPISLNNLASAFNTRYGQLGKLEDLEECILLNRNSLSFYPPGHRLRPTVVNNLALALTTRYEQLGDIEDLEESIMFHRETLTLFPPGHSDISRSTSLNNLAFALMARHKWMGTTEDLEDCILFNREALALRPPGHQDRPISLNNLASAFITRYGQLGKLEDLEECILLNRNALSFYPPGHPNRFGRLNNLASALGTRYRRLGQMEDLEECIQFHREALTLCPPSQPHRSVLLDNLARVLSARYKQLGNMEDLEESISLNHNALTLRPPGHPDRSLSLKNWANDLESRFEKLRKLEDLRHTFTSYEQAASDPTSYLKDRLAAAFEWAQIARNHQHESMLKAYTISLQLLQRSLISRTDVEAQQKFLGTGKVYQPLASDAASAAIQAGNLELAVEFLEQGRGMLWSQMDAYKYPLEALRQVKPDGGELAGRLETLSAELERLVLLSDRTASLTGESSTGSAVSLDARMKQHRLLSEEWEDLVRRIRDKPGFLHFLETPPFDALQSAAVHGPVIFINISHYRSDAIFLTIDKPPTLVPLPDIDLAELDAQVPRLKTNQGIIGVLRYLWNTIASPVVTCLVELGVEKKSRIWWCPTAKLCALPLHAAGPYRLREPNLLDLYTSSYTSTLSSLIRARSNIHHPPQAPKLLVVGQPHETLQKVGDEVDIIKEHGDVVDVLLGAEASHEAVLEGLKHHSWVHFACHGHLGDDSQPFRASFELHNGRRLTLLELIQARLPNAESAFLAACHSAAGDARTPDENIHLSAALQFCGFRSVVGTLWEMDDEDGPMMSREFYKYMFRDPARIDFRDSAYALSSAVREMRKAKLPPERWVMFVHIGA